MTGRGRRARIVSDRPAVKVGKRNRPCPVCGATVGWQCTKKVGDQILPRKNDHPERRRAT